MHRAQLAKVLSFNHSGRACTRSWHFSFSFIKQWNLRSHENAVNYLRERPWAHHPFLFFGIRNMVGCFQLFLPGRAPADSWRSWRRASPASFSLCGMESRRMAAPPAATACRPLEACAPWLASWRSWRCPQTAGISALTRRVFGEACCHRGVADCLPKWLSITGVVVVVIVAVNTTYSTFVCSFLSFFFQKTENRFLSS